jgi:uncharacterized protein (DUF4415 family)
MKKKSLQIFTREQLMRDRSIPPEAILQFLEDFRLLHADRNEKGKPISLRVPANLLSAFQFKAKQQGKRYQSEIIALMRAWVEGRL